MMKAMRLIWAIAASLLMGAVSPCQTPGAWEQPAAALAEQIAGILGPGQARMTIRNTSTIPIDEIPAIRKLLEQDLKAHGVLASGAESASAIRVTLSENVRERLWVAEVIEGSETHVAMVRVEPGATRQPAAGGAGLVLRKEIVLATKKRVLTVLEAGNGLVAVEPEEIVLYGKSGDGWQEQKRAAIGQKRALARDPRGVILPDAAGDGFEAFVAGMACTGAYAASDTSGAWPVKCRESDDPWPVASGPFSSGPTATAGSGESTASIKAFYNAARDYFTGVVTPNAGVDLPAFYSAAQLPRPSGAALLIGGIDGKVQIAENGAIKGVSGTRDWGSDFTVLRSGCGAGDQVIASGSGEAASDSLRAYELPALEAVPVSAPLAMDGTVMAIWTAPDGKSVLAAVMRAAGDYEVDRVTALCD
jgi:hypothetical protein